MPRRAGFGLSRILITGASGMLGSTLASVLHSKDIEFVATDIDLSPPGTELLDVRDFAAVDETVTEHKPSLVIHLAAETNVERCEAEPSHAYRTNTIGTQNVAVSCNRHGVPLVYVSTAGVFNGTKAEPYNEFDQPDPINIYGKSKYQGELIVRALVARSFIARAGWMIGGKERDKKFVGKIVKQLGEGRRRIYAVTDKLGTPTYTYDFCQILLKLLDTSYWGTYHLACKGSGTRFDVAAHIIKTLGLDDRVELIGTNSDHFKLEYPAPRPASESMVNQMLELRGMNSMRDWKDSLTEYLNSHHSIELQQVHPTNAR